MRKHLSTLLKIGVTVLGLGYVILNVPLAEIVDILSNLVWVWALLALILIAASLVLRAYRWLLLLHGLGTSVPFSRLVELYYVGNFFNAFLPSGFGGDAIRILEVARDVPGNVAAGTVIVDRLTGLMMLFAMALMALPFRPDDFPQELLLVVVTVCLTGLIAGSILLDGRLIRRFGSWLPAKLSPVGDGPVARLLQAVQGCGRKAIVGAFAVSAAFNLLLAAWWAAAGKAIGIDVPYAYYLLVVPVLSVALLVPSISGLGVREYLAPILFAGAGVTPAEAVALSLVVFILMRIVSLIGGPWYIIATVKENRRRATASSLEKSANR